MATRGTPPASSEAIRERMRATKRRDTAAEMALRRELHRRGLRYRVDQAPLASVRRRADIVFRPRRVAVFVDGCFWHSCPLHGTIPRANREWWQQKLEANARRDRCTDQTLLDASWQVIRVWEHEDPIAAADRVMRALRRAEARPQEALASTERA